MKKSWLVEYSTDQWPTHQIVIYCNDRSEVRGILKKHLGKTPFRITRITERSVNRDVFPREA